MKGCWEWLRQLTVTAEEMQERWRYSEQGGVSEVQEFSGVPQRTPLAHGNHDPKGTGPSIVKVLFTPPGKEPWPTEVPAENEGNMQLVEGKVATL